MMTVLCSSATFLFFLIMHNTEKNKKRQSHQVQLAMANFFEFATGTSTFSAFYNDFTDLFTVLMTTDEAENPDFREKAVLIMQFAKAFNESFSKFDWKTVYDEAQRLKTNASLKLLPTNEL